MDKRCKWASDDLMMEYHDNEWGVPVHDDRKLFEFLILEGAQAGLPWSTILKRRKGYQLAFSNFNASKVAEFGDKKLSVKTGWKIIIDFRNCQIIYNESIYPISPVGIAAQELILTQGLENWVKENI